VQAVVGSTAQADAGRAALETAFVLPTRSCGNYFIVDAMVDGKGPFPMLLDTGAGTTTISPSMSQATGASDWIHSFQVDRFHATGNIECQVQELAHLGRALGVEIQGIVGYGVFEGMLLTYDYPAKQIRLEERSFTASEISKPNVVPTSTGKRPYIRVSAGSVEFTALVDTGSSRNLTFKKFERFSFEEPPIPTGGSMKVSGLYLVKSGRVNHNIQVGPLTLSQPIVNSTRGTDLFGQGLMRDFIVTFDQVQHYVRFEKPHGSWQTPIESPPLFGTGMIANPKDDRLIVIRVFEGSAAHQAGLLVNDEILASNGVAIADRDCSHWDSKSDLESTPVDLLVLRNGEKLHVKFSTDILVK
jgi:hypothetical protein